MILYDNIARVRTDMSIKVVVAIILRKEIRKFRSDSGRVQSHIYSMEMRKYLVIHIWGAQSYMTLHLISSKFLNI
jgi:hypothetical protein